MSVRPQAISSGAPDPELQQRPDFGASLESGAPIVDRGIL